MEEFGLSLKLLGESLREVEILFDGYRYCSSQRRGSLLASVGGIWRAKRDLSSERVLQSG